MVPLLGIKIFLKHLHFSLINSPRFAPQRRRGIPQARDTHAVSSSRKSRNRNHRLKGQDAPGATGFPTDVEPIRAGHPCHLLMVHRNYSQFAENIQPRLLAIDIHGASQHDCAEDSGRTRCLRNVCRRRTAHLQARPRQTSRGRRTVRRQGSRSGSSASCWSKPIPIVTT